MARRIEVEIVGDSRSLERAFARSERSAQKFDREMGRTSRSASASLQSAAIGWQSAVAAGALLLGRSFVKASRNAEIILGQTKVALTDAGLSWERYGKTIEAASMRISTSSAFDDEAVLQSFQTFGRGQKDVAKSIRLTELAADVARGRYIDLEQATQLVNKAAMGQIGALRRAGIQIDKNATSAEALDALLRAYTGSAQTYADSATGSSEKLQVAFENLAEQAGGPLSEGLAEVAGQLTDLVGLMDTLAAKKIPVGPGTVGGLLTDIGGLAGRNLPFLGPILNAAGALTGGGVNGDFGAGGRGGGGDFALPPKQGPSAMPFLNTIDDIVAFTTKWVDAGKRFDDASKKWEATQKAAAARRARMELQRERFRQGLENQEGWLAFGVERAGATKTLADDRRALKKQEDWLKNRIRHEGRTLRLVSDLWRVRQQIRDLNKKHADKDPLAGLMQVSSKRLAQTLAAGTGIGPGGMGRLQANIAGQEIAVYTNVHLDGQHIATAVNRHNARGGARAARQTSGFRG